MAATVDGTLNLRPTIKEGETPVGVGGKREGPWKRTPNMLIPEKQIAMDEPGGSLQYIADVATKTPVGAFNLVGKESYRTPMTINIQASAARSEGGVPVVYPNEVRFEFDTRHVGIGGYCRAAIDGNTVIEAGVYKGNFFFDGTSMYQTEGGSYLKDYLASDALATQATLMEGVFKTDLVSANPPNENFCQRRNPAYIPAATPANGAISYFHLPTLARNTRLEIFSSVELKFNNSTTVMKVTEPGRLYRYVNDFFGPKALYSDSCGDISTCPTQYSFPKTLYQDTTGMSYEADPLVEVTNPIKGDQRRYHCGEWFDRSRIYDDGKYTVYLADIFPAFDKDELMTMPAFTITFNFAENFREKFTTYPNTYMTTVDTSTPPVSIATSTISYSPTTFEDAAALSQTTFTQTNTGTVFAYKHTDYFGIVGCTYKAPTYATKHIMVPRLFNNAYKSYELVEHTIQNTDPNVRIVKTLTRPPVGAFIFFATKSTENGPLNTSSSEYVSNTFNERWWPLNRQVVKITTWKDSLEQTLGTSEYMQWRGTNGRRLNREHLLRENRELAGSRTRQFNTFWADSADFIKKPFIAVRFDNDIVDPATVKTTVTDTRYVTNEYIIEMKFDFINPEIARSEGDEYVITTGDDSMQDRKLIAVFIYEHNFKSLGDNVISTQVN